jgi:hypothetical protein
MPSIPRKGRLRKSEGQLVYNAKTKSYEQAKPGRRGHPTPSIPKWQGKVSGSQPRKGRTTKATPKDSIVSRGPKSGYVVYDRQQPGYWTGKGRHQFCGAENRDHDTECLKPKGHPGNHRYSGIL